LLLAPQRHCYYAAAAAAMHASAILPLSLRCHSAPPFRDAPPILRRHTPFFAISLLPPPFSLRYALICRHAIDFHATPFSFAAAIVLLSLTRRHALLCAADFRRRRYYRRRIAQRRDAPTPLIAIIILRLLL